MNTITLNMGNYEIKYKTASDETRNGQGPTLVFWEQVELYKLRLSR